MPALVRARTELSGPGRVRSHLISFARPATHKNYGKLLSHMRTCLWQSDVLGVTPGDFWFPSFSLSLSGARERIRQIVSRALVSSRHPESSSLWSGATGDEDGHETRTVCGAGNIQPRPVPGTHSNYHILMLIIFSFCVHEGVQVHYLGVLGDQWWC